MKRLPPELMSEVSSRLLAVAPALREAFALDEATMSGQELELLLCSNYLVGFADGLSDAGELRDGQTSALVEWALRQEDAA